MKNIEAYPIWQMKFCTKEVLVDRLKVNSEKVYIYFCCDRNYTDLYSFDGDYVRNNCKLCTNGKIICYRIPIEYLHSEGDLPEKYIKIREKEYNKYIKYKNISKR